jgi:hypothetical protein
MNEFVRMLQPEAPGDTDAQRRAADRYIDASRELHRRLDRHLNDEEDLIIPLMIRQGA